MPDTQHTSRSRRLAAGPHARLTALALTVLLASCGGGNESGPVAASGDEPVQAEPAPGLSVAADDGTAQRSFRLWPEGAQQSIQSEQMRAGGDAQTYARLIVQLNPAAVQANGRALVASAPKGGEAGAAGAARAQALAAKASAVALASDGVMARSVLPRTTAATVRQQFTQALEGFVLSVPWAQAQEVADAMARDPAVDSVEVDRAFKIGQTVTTRTLPQAVWGVDRVDQRTRTYDTRFIGSYTGSGVRAYVVDTGIAAHSQFGTRLASGFTSINDGNGTSDCQGHGTHVAGTIGGATTGVAPAVTLVPVRTLDCAGSGTAADVLAGLDWIAAQGVRPGVVNMSLGGPASAAVDSAVQRLMGLGFQVVTAAGNSNVDACTVSPARVAGAVAVAATDSTDAKASYSNWGTCVALSAPGTTIASAAIGSTTALSQKSGTSMASPHVAGAAALLLQVQPAATPRQLRERLIAQATPNVVTGVPTQTSKALLFAGDALVTPALPALTLVQPAALAMSTDTPTLGQWRARAGVTVRNLQGGAVANVRVAGRFSSSTTEVTCTTVADGTCTLVSPAVAWSTVTSVSVQLTSLTGTGLDDNGAGMRQGQVTRPAAPVASVATLTGSVVRTSPTATSWTPRFVATVRDAANVALAGAVVPGTLTVYTGKTAGAARSVTCTTDALGSCTINGVSVPNTTTGAVLQVGTITRTFLVDGGGGVRRATAGTPP